MSGIHDVYLGEDYRWLKPNDHVILPGNYLCPSIHVRACSGYCIHFKTEFIQPLLKGSLNEDFPFFDFETEHIISITQSEILRIQEAFDSRDGYENFLAERMQVQCGESGMNTLNLISKVATGSSTNRLCNREGPIQNNIYEEV